MLTQRERKIIETILTGHGAANKALAARLFAWRAAQTESVPESPV